MTTVSIERTSIETDPTPFRLTVTPNNVLTKWVKAASWNWTMIGAAVIALVTTALNWFKTMVSTVPVTVSINVVLMLPESTSRNEVEVEPERVATVGVVKRPENVPV